MYTFHIGLEKTGTSTLQRLMAANAAVLEGRGIIYPWLDETKKLFAHHDLVRTLRRGEDMTLWTELRHIRQRAPRATIVISAEGFTTSSPAAVRDAIESHDVRVVAYVRPFPTWLVSSYSQKAKWGSIGGSFDQFVDTVGRNRATSVASNILDWAEVFGADRVRVRSLDPQALEQGDIADDFLKVISTSREGLHVPPDANVTPDWRIVELLKQRNGASDDTVGPDGAPGAAMSKARRLSLAIAAGEALGWRSKGDYLTLGQRQEFGEIYRECARRLRQAIPDCRITEVEDAPRDRPFLPCPEAVTSRDRQDFDNAFDMAAAQAAQRRRESSPQPAASRSVPRRSGEGDRFRNPLRNLRSPAR